MRFKIFGLALVFAAGLAGTVAEAQQGNTITVPVTGLRNNTGEVRCGLFNSAATFPTNGQQFQGVVSPITNQQATCTFTNVPPGTYAVAIFHAERPGQTTMDTSAMWLSEGWLRLLAQCAARHVWPAGLRRRGLRLRRRRRVLSDHDHLSLAGHPPPNGATPRRRAIAR